ncbi:eIF-2-alpha kinase GCN2-like protein [Elsinoe fawcettii]|nr:eIF-2-alpha kinase GCN2-like protein [Elsinoe fawcettii]
MTTINYAQIQEEELHVLSAIYMEDYREIPLKSAWNKTSGRAFELKLRSSDDSDVVVVLTTTFTATYPKTPPLVEGRGMEGLHEKTQRLIMSIIKDRPAKLAKQLDGEVLMHLIIDEVKDVLDEAAALKAEGVLPSLEDERALREAAGQAQEKAVEEAARQRQQKDQAEAEKLLQADVERRRQQVAALQTLPSPVREDQEEATMSADMVAFEDAIETAGSNGETFTFKKVEIINEISKSGHSEELLVRPGRRIDVVFKLRRVSIRAPAEHTELFTANLTQLESELNAIKKLRHEHVNAVYSSRLDRQVIPGPDVRLGYSLSILSELSNRGSLDEKLEDGQTIALNIARQWSSDLLNALEYLHNNDIVHKQINPTNVRLYRSQHGVTMPQLSGTGYNYRLDILLDGKPSSDKPMAWRAPEVRQSPEATSTKIDIWDFGVVVLQMVCGLDVIRKFESPDAFMRIADLTDSFADLLRKFFAKDPRRRPRAIELIPSEFLRESPNAFNDSREFDRTPQLSRHASHSNTHGLQLKNSRQSSWGAMDALVPAYPTRYKSEYTEMEILGRGGFGAVVKARYKVDNSQLAIKKIKSQSRAQLEHVLQEVVVLARLNHPYVVRYYQAWVEEDLSAIPLDSAVTSSDENPFGTSLPERSRYESRASDFLGDDEYDSDEDAGTVADVDDGAAGSRVGSDDDDSESDSEDAHIDGNGTASVHDNTNGSAVAGDSNHDDDGIVFGDDSMQAGHSNEVNDGIVFGGDSALIALPKSKSPAVEGPTTEAPRLLRSRRPQPVRERPSILYIPMELCEKKTLRHPIDRDMPLNPEKQWLMLRQILQGLEHIHSHGIIHRDLKPDNIFIDQNGNPRIGDFGLATTSSTGGPDQLLASQGTSGDMSKGMGTALYIAPELQKIAKGKYSSKVDMYSLGIIFFEMCYRLSTMMERDQEIRKIRNAQHQLPAVFSTPEKSDQGKIILSLINHNQNERPTCTQLLQSGKIPSSADDELIRVTLQNARTSDQPLYHKVLASLFTTAEDQQVRDLVWDAHLYHGESDGEEELRKSRILAMLRSTIESVVRTHGAEETRQTVLVPHSSMSDDPDVTRLLDPAGNLLQLPYDLTLPRARSLSKAKPQINQTFTFGQVSRRDVNGGASRLFDAFSFDIVSTTADESAMCDAETIKVLDELVDHIPTLAGDSIAYHLNHTEILEAILDHCKVEMKYRKSVKHELQALGNSGITWKQVREKLRSSENNVPTTVLDELSKFDFQQSLEKVPKKFKALLAASPQSHDRVLAALGYLHSVMATLNNFGFHRTLFIAPLSTYKDAYYQKGIMFQVFIDKSKRKVFGGGGRYDSLVQFYRPPNVLAQSMPRAVGFQISLDYIYKKTKFQTSLGGSSKFTKAEAHSKNDASWMIRRCEVLIFPSVHTLANTICAGLLSTLWTAGISAELASPSLDMDAIFSHQKPVHHGFIIKVNHESASHVRIINTTTDDDEKVAINDIITHLRSQLRERDAPLLKSRRPPAYLVRGNSVPETAHEPSSPVMIPPRQGRRKKNQHGF